MTCARALQVLVDTDLTANMLRQQLLQRVMLFAPECVGGGAGLRAQRPPLDKLSADLEAAVKALCSLAQLEQSSS